MLKTFYIQTFGCQMNVYDSLRVSSMLTQRGMIAVDKPENADIIILNTCSVREKASEKVFSALGRLKTIKKNREKITKHPVIMGIMGCVARDQGSNAFKRQKALNFILGPQSYHKLADIIDDENLHYMNIDLTGLEKFDSLPKIHESPSVGYIPIQEGCNHVCTYCVVPYTRGPELSRDFNDVMAEVKHTAELGAIEICFLGQNVNGYKDKNGKNLADLIKETAKIDSVKRIRFTSSYPTEMTDDLLELFGTCEKLLPFLNMPLQSGSPSVLKRMNRPYNLDQYIGIVNKLRSIRPDIQISSDFIVGFPGETDDEFQDTIKMANKIGYINSYSFKYSPRSHTVAAKMDAQISDKVKQDRLKVLDTLLMEKQREFNLSCVGKEFDCLIDEYGKLKNQAIARTPYMQPVILNDAVQYIGQIKKIKILSANKSALRGEIKDENNRYKFI